MSSQINIKKQYSHQAPPTGMLGYGFDSLGNPVVILENGTAQQIGGTSATANLIANRGVGLVADLPSSGTEGDIYVATDTLKYYLADSLGDFVEKNLTAKQFITDTSDVDWLLYQYNGVEIKSCEFYIIDEKVNLTNPENKTPSGIPTNQSDANIEYTKLFNAITSQLARLSSASATFAADNPPVLITTTETLLPVDIVAPSLNTDIIEINDIDEYITLKVAGRYQFLTNSVIENISTNSPHTVTIRTRNYTTDALITERTIEVTKDTIFPDVAFVSLDLPEGSEPLSLYVTVQAGANSVLYINSLYSQLTIGGIAASTTDKYVAVSATDTTPGYLQQKQTFGNEFESIINNPAGNENILTTFKGWIYNASRTFYSNITSLATSNRNVNLPNKDGTIAFLDDIIGGAAERENTTQVISTSAQTYTVDFSNSIVKTLDISDAVTTLILAVSNLSTTERPNCVVIDNTDNTSGLTVTFDDQYSTIKFRRAKNEFPGVYPDMNVPAGAIWEMEFETRSTTLVTVDFLDTEE